VQRPVAALVLGATALSSVAYPALYGQVIACTWTGCALMLARNGLLAAAAVLSLVRLWRSTRPAPATPAPTPGPDPVTRRLPQHSVAQQSPA